jgi:hypothetical protein
MLDNLICPISNIRIDRNVVRINGFITTCLLAAYVYTGSPWIIVPVGLDYVIRAMMKGPTSPMAHFARFVAKRLGIPYRAMDKAPKVFASRIGVCFAMGGAITYFVAPWISPWLAGTLAVFTTLESVFDLCVGCVVYTYIALPLYKARDAVKSIPLFRNLEEPMLVAVAEGFRSVQIPKDTRIITEGEPGNEMFVIRDGQVEVYHEGQAPITTYKKGNFFGEMALLTGNPRNASVRAITPVVALNLQKSDFDGLLQKHHGMREILEKTAAERMALEESQKVI